jgi:hypothetical protein
MHADVRSPRGVSVRVTERGLPVDLTLEERALTIHPAELARHLLQLCQRGARRAQAQRANTLRDRGYSAETVRSLHLAKEPADTAQRWPTEAHTADVGHLR